MIKFVPYFIVIGLLAAVLVGWAVAYWHDRRAKEKDDAERGTDQ